MTVRYRHHPVRDGVPPRYPLWILQYLKWLSTHSGDTIRRLVSHLASQKNRAMLHCMSPPSERLAMAVGSQDSSQSGIGSRGHRYGQPADKRQVPIEES